MRIIITFLLLSIFSKCFAQGYLEGAILSYDLMPLKVQNTGNQVFYGNNFKLNDYFPVFLKKDKSQYLLVGLNLEAFNFTGIHPDFPVTDLYSIAPVLGYSRKVSSKLNLSAITIPFLNSDLYEVKSSDIHFGGIIRGTYHVQENFSIKLTVGYRQQFYGTQYVVLAGIDWKISDKCRLFGEMPTYATLSYSISPKTNAGVSYLSGNTSYDLTEQDHYIQYVYAQPGLFAEYYLSPILALRSTIAYSTERKLDIYNMNDKVSGGVVDYINLGPQATPLNTEVSNGPILKLSLSLRIPEPKNK